MKVLLVHKFHKVTGGAEVFYFEVARVLKKNKHTVAFFTTITDGLTQDDETVYQVKSPSYNSGNVLKNILNSSDIFYSSKKYQCMKHAIAEFKPDVIHVFALHVHLTPSVLEAAKEASIPVVMSCNDYKHICPNYKLFDGKKICEACLGGKFYNAVLKKCCKGSFIFSVASAIEAYVHEYKNVYDRLVDRYLFSSQFMLDKTKKFWPSKTVEYGILRNPFNVNDYTPVYAGDYALYFGRVIVEKGVDRIIQAARITNIPIKIVGDGPDLEEIRAYAKNESLDHVEFLGPLWGDEMVNVLYGARYVIIPSLWHENFPYVIFQSFAAGKPVIGSLRGGIPELIGNDRGLTFDPEDITELASRMDELWADVGKCDCMGKAARNYVESEFTDENFYEALMQNYKAVIK